LAELRISDISGRPGGRRRVRVSWREEGALPREAEAVFDDPFDEINGERIRWYIEDYAEFPADPAPTIARGAEAQLRGLGTMLFRRIFEANPDTMLVWHAVMRSLPEARVEVDADPGEGPGLSWELLRDPARDAAIALGAGAFVRTHLRAAGLPEPAGDRLRVLLVIARPGGRTDVPFRSVASRLVRGGAEQMTGLDLHVLRPATFRRLSEVLLAAKVAKRPYHVVHFDGHGSWLDLADLGIRTGSEGGDGKGGAGSGIALSPLMYGVSVVGPVRRGEHGYLVFEDPGSEHNVQLVDGPALGRLLTDAGVAVLVLNACRSAYAEAREQPADTAAAEPGNTRAVTATGGSETVLTGDVHARIRAYGSLAAEIADIGVPGVVAMRYNVYVVTAAQFMADLYAHLLAGKSLGQAATAARKALAADPVRQIGATPVSLQDWVVPVVYESAPLVLLRPPQRVAPLVKLNLAETAPGNDSAQPTGVPRPPDVGFFGRDETLLALDRAFDTQPIVLLHAFAGAGKSSTAAEFARWYQVTGGLDYPGHPEGWPSAVLWSSFEHYLTADRVIGIVGDRLASLLEANGIIWQAVTDPRQRRDIIMPVLAQVPVLWVWDNVEPVAGFPAGRRSDWTPDEQDDLANLLRDLAQHTQCKVLITSRQDERTWLGDLPARVRLPPMPMRESMQLAGALAARYGQNLSTADWRPLLRHAAGNPLTVTVVVGQALRAGLATTNAIEGYVAALRAGETALEAEQDAALGRSRSLAAALNYGFAHAFTSTERAQLAVLHLFRDTVNADAFRGMGYQDGLREDTVPELAGLDREAAIGLLDRAAAIGLLEALVGGYYRIHPALPWYFATLFTASYGQPDSHTATGAARAYARAVGALGDFYHNEAEGGRAAEIVPLLEAEEANLCHALSLSRSDGLRRAASGCLQGLSTLYERTGRDGEWARLVAIVTPDVTDPDTDGPLPDRSGEWSIITGYRVVLAGQARDWPTATTLQTARTAWAQDQAAEAQALPADSLTPLQRNQIRTLGVCLTELGNILRFQDDPDCLRLYREALMLDQQIGDRQAEAIDASTLGNTYLAVGGLRDLDQAEYWYQRSLNLRSGSDQLGLATNLGQLGSVAIERFRDALEADESELVLQEHSRVALRNYLKALYLLAADDHQHRGTVESQLGLVYFVAGDINQALRHHQKSLQHKEHRGDTYAAGETRLNIASMLNASGRIGDALQYARAALHNFQQVGSSATADAAQAERLIANWESSLPGNGQQA
jgi:tetratricopeptide (TPR) repeat protein